MVEARSFGDFMNTWQTHLIACGLIPLAALVSGCGGDSETANGSAICTGDCECSGNTCSCKAGGACTFGPVTGDAGVGDASSAPVLPNDVTYHCDSQNQCDLTCGTGCTSTCAGSSACVGTCTDNCTSSCTGTSQCTLETGTNSEVTCAGGSDCTVTLDTDSTVTCGGNSACAIDCPKGGCTAECAGSTSCTVECGGTVACHIDCNGIRSQDCAAGSTCAGVCQDQTD